MRQRESQRAGVHEHREVQLARQRPEPRIDAVLPAERAGERDAPGDVEEVEVVGEEAESKHLGAGADDERDEPGDAPCRPVRRGRRGGAAWRRGSAASRRPASHGG